MCSGSTRVPCLGWQKGSRGPRRATSHLLLACNTSPSPITLLDGHVICHVCFNITSPHSHTFASITFVPLQTCPICAAVLSLQPSPLSRLTRLPVRSHKGVACVPRHEPLEHPMSVSHEPPAFTSPSRHKGLLSRRRREHHTGRLQRHARPILKFDCPALATRANHASRLAIVLGLAHLAVDAERAARCRRLLLSAWGGHLALFTSGGALPSAAPASPRMMSRPSKSSVSSIGLRSSVKVCACFTPPQHPTTRVFKMHSA